VTEEPFRSRTDKPRQVVICHPDDFTNVNAAVMKMRLGDVLVQSNRYAEIGRAYVIDGVEWDGWRIPGARVRWLGRPVPRGSLT
jgi:hypothetical protein